MRFYFKNLINSKILLLFVFLFLSTTALRSQNVLITNGRDARETFINGDFEKAVKHFDKIYEVSPYWFNNLFSLYVTKSLHNNKEREFLQKYAESSVESANIIYPLHFYTECYYTKDQPKLQSKFLLFRDSLLKGKSSSIYAPLAYTAAYIHFVKKLKLKPSIKEKILKQLLQINTINKNYRKDKAISLKKYLDLVLYNELYKLDEAGSRKVLEVQITPDDLRNITVFPFANNNETGLDDAFDLKQKHVKNLLENEKSIQNLKFTADLVSMKPTLNNLDDLKDIFPDSMDFQSFWYNYSHKGWSTFKAPERIANWIDSLTNEDQWLLIDVWGTWCASCLQEMPDLIEMHRHFEKMPDRPIKFLTFSYNSKNLQEFMNKRNYSFPVIEITKNENNKLGIYSYPTTFLIAPDGKFTILPYGQDKAEMVKVFTLVNW
ncbi:MAG: TlpA family protein disulfide reductase [Bacteroidales bacterium]|nr:TlpA family protein disulfide reductase [Bacteroidales bacterium]